MAPFSPIGRSPNSLYPEIERGTPLDSAFGGAVDTCLAATDNGLRRLSMIVLGALCLVRLLSGLPLVTLAVAQSNALANPPTAHRVLLPFGEAGSKVIVTGFVVRRDDKYFAVQLADMRILRLRIGPETRGYINGRTVALDTYRLGDAVRVDAISDGKGYLTVSRIALERHGTPEERTRVAQSPEWRRENAIQADTVDPSADDRRLSVYMRAPMPADPQISTPTAIQVARDRIKSLLRVLPNFMVRTVTRSFVSSSRPPAWDPNGVVTAEVRYLDGSESQYNVEIDGRLQPEPLREDDLAYRIRESGKPGSFGEFGGLLSCVFSPYAMANFRFLRMDQVGTHNVVVYSLAIDRRNSCIAILAGSQVAYPTWQGLVSVDNSSRDVVRLEMEATDIPAEFPYDRAERRIDYDRVKIGSGDYEMPVNAYWFGCYRSTYDCWLNRIEFRDYRQFKTESTIRFGEIK
jgi:hypothetical protein